MRPLNHLSISTRLALWYGLSLTLLLGLVVAFLYTGFHLTLHRDFDAALAAEAERVAAALPREAVSETDDFAEVPAFAGAAEASPYAVYVLGASGRTLYTNGRFPDLTPHLPRDGDGASTHTHGSDEPVRTRVVAVRGDPEPLWVAVAGPESGLHRETHRLAWLLALGVALGVGVAAASGYGLARRALRPVSALTEAAGRIGLAERGARLPTGEAPHDELGDLAAAFNGLLARLDDGFERERRFRADAAHELLTPVTAARSEIDVALRRDREPEAYREALGRLRRHVERMGGLVGDLLALSRAEAEGHGGPGTVDLDTLVDALTDRMRPAAEAKGVSLVREPSQGTLARGAGSDVEVALENMLDNAVKYTPPGGTVTVSVRREGADAVVGVADTGAGFGEAEAQRLFERFYRADDPAVQGEAGSGLGLAISQRLAERHGGRVTAASRGPGTGSRFELRLPAPSDERPSGAPPALPRTVQA